MVDVVLWFTWLGSVFSFTADFMLFEEPNTLVGTNVSNLDVVTIEMLSHPKKACLPKSNHTGAHTVQKTHVVQLSDLAR